MFTLEFLLRLWIAPESESGQGTPPWRARVAYARSAAGVFDLLAFLPSTLNLVAPFPVDWLRVLRLCRLLKVGRYAPGLPLFAAVIRNERRPLIAALLVMMVLLVLESGIMYVLEREAQPQVFASIPHAMWWAIVTMATVGYGDIAPVTPLGKVFGGMVMIIGIAMFAVPAGILATGFAIEIRKRDFVVTWHTVARVPLFSSLDAARIAEIARLLKREVVPAKYAVVRRGEPADAMFFIMSGEVEVDVQPVPRRMGRGQFFGEIALLTETVRTATVTAITECELLVLDVADFRRLLEAHEDVKECITRVAEQRLSASASGEPAR
jgi:voltage-gated potassium channel